MSVYVDTSAFYAIVDSSDANHQTAAATWQRLLRDKEELWTSSFALTETLALFHNRLGTDVVRRFVDDNLPAVRIHWVDWAMYSTALGAMLATPGRRGPSLADCTGLEVMRLLRTRRIFAYDQHYANLGLDVLG